MASQLERDVLVLTGGNPERLRDAIQEAHGRGWHIAAPQQAIMDVFARVLAKPGGNILSASQEVIRGHAYAHGLEGEVLTASNQHFVETITEYFL